jgi:hypothetical protein
MGFLFVMLRVVHGRLQKSHFFGWLHPKYPNGVHGTGWLMR